MLRRVDKTVARIARTGLIAFWIAAGASFFFEAEGAALFRYAFWAVLAVHAVEFMAFSGQLRRAPGSSAGHFARTLVFGFLHILEVRTAAAGAAEPS